MPSLTSPGAGQSLCFCVGPFFFFEFVVGSL
jgi:hypothetical protein